MGIDVLKGTFFQDFMNKMLYEWKIFELIEQFITVWGYAHSYLRVGWLNSYPAENTWLTNWIRVV
jgi:hypothetical protein